jgi:hypothetical protein
MYYYAIHKLDLKKDQKYVLLCNNIKYEAGLDVNDVQNTLNTFKIKIILLKKIIYSTLFMANSN